MLKKALICGVLLVCFSITAGAQQDISKLKVGDKMPQSVLDRLPKRQQVPQAQQPPPTGIALPQGLFETEEDKQAWMELVEMITVFERQYHRKPTGKEMAGWLRNGLENADPHTQVLEAREAKDLHDRIGGEFGGVGMEIEKIRDPELPHGIRVLPLPDHPAEKAGIRPKDIVIEICPVIEEKGADKIDTCRKTASMTLPDAVDLLKGPIKSKVHVVVWREGKAEPLRFTITRDNVVVNPIKKAEIKDGYAYIEIRAFTEGLADKFRTTLKDLEAKHGKPLKGLTIDVGKNPGGLLHEAHFMLVSLLSGSAYVNGDAAIIISQEARGKIKPISSAQGAKDVMKGAPIVVIVSGASASASEILAGVLQLHGRASIAGVEKSFGKGTIQEITPLQNSKSELRLTVAQYLIGSKGCEKAVQGIGVSPDILLKKQAGDLLVESREDAFENALPSSTVSNANCKYTFSVPAEHKVVAREMLKTFGFEVQEPPKTN